MEDRRRLELRALQAHDRLAASLAAFREIVVPALPEHSADSTAGRAKENAADLVLSSRWREPTH
jgi:hypothetical protein